ncbi:Imm52 family immunity protein [Streptomyces tropicalis]|uniref:Immunity protein 52 domain-containing protein n=1 Tax=Streptomyces tropicalis TaxID=3034234 RepID=A0ABT6A0G6_9ACTN|nr:Imm52 family immunity protein [Streptomyces tropicalis]MDF3298133.1 hypothetical protein [Streptomyces tropicalis]
MDRLVRGFWGPRPETETEVAARCAAFLTALADVFPDAPAVWHGVRDSGPDVDVPARADAIESLLRDGAAGRDDTDAVGHRIALYAPAGGGTTLDVSGSAGGAPRFAPHAMVVQVDGPAGDDPRTLLATLRALADAWDVDWGDVTDDALMDELEDAGLDLGAPVAGLALYLSRGRAERLGGTALPVPAEPGPHGGVLLDLPAPGSSGTAVGLNRALAATGALDPLPRPMTAPKL